MASGSPADWWPRASHSPGTGRCCGAGSARRSHADRGRPGGRTPPPRRGDTSGGCRVPVVRGDGVAAGVYWHRGPLVHLLATYPGARPTSRTGWAVVATGYASALSAAVCWRNHLAAIVLAPHRRRPGRSELPECRRSASPRPPGGGAEVAAGLAGVVVLGVLVRLVFPAADVAVPLLLAYEVAMIMAAARLEIGLTPATAGSVTDLVVDLGDGRAGVLRDAFAEALRDPTVRFGYWDRGPVVFRGRGRPPDRSAGPGRRSGDDHDRSRRSPARRVGARRRGADRPVAGRGDSGRRPAQRRSPAPAA